MGTDNKRDFIQVNGPPLGYKGTWNFLNAVLMSMYGYTLRKDVLKNKNMHILIFSM